MTPAGAEPTAASNVAISPVPGTAPGVLLQLPPPPSFHTPSFAPSQSAFAAKLFAGIMAIIRHKKKIALGKSLKAIFTGRKRLRFL